jgi:hypothetical protein
MRNIDYVIERTTRGKVTVTALCEDGCRYEVEHLGGQSLTGFEFGYVGSGPADLATSLLADALGEDITLDADRQAGRTTRTGRHSAALEDEVVARRCTQQGAVAWSISREEILTWLGRQGA